MMNCIAPAPLLREKRSVGEQSVIAGVSNCLLLGRLSLSSFAAYSFLTQSLVIIQETLFDIQVSCLTQIFKSLNR